LTLLGRAESARSVGCLAARGAEIKRTRGSLVVRRAMGNGECATKGRGDLSPIGLWRRIMIKP